MRSGVVGVAYAYSFRWAGTAHLRLAGAHVRRTGDVGLRACVRAYAYACLFLRVRARTCGVPRWGSRAVTSPWASRTHHTITITINQRAMAMWEGWCPGQWVCGAASPHLRIPGGCARARARAHSYVKTADGLSCVGVCGWTGARVGLSGGVVAVVVVVLLRCSRAAILRVGRCFLYLCFFPLVLSLFYFFFLLFYFLFLFFIFILFPAVFLCFMFYILCGLFVYSYHSAFAPHLSGRAGWYTL